MVTVGGNVVLMQGKNVLKGDRLVIDLKTGESRFENTGNTAAGGRIRALFVPKARTPSRATTAARSQAGDTKSAKDGKQAAPSRPKPDGARPGR